MIEAWFDGSFRLNDGNHIMGIGGVVKVDGVEVYCFADTIREQGSSNTAEYLALIKVLEFLLEAKYNGPILIRGDSKLVINQINGFWDIKEGTYVLAAFKAAELFKELKNVKIKWTSRYNNIESDKLSKYAKTNKVGPSSEKP